MVKFRAGNATVTVFYKTLAKSEGEGLEQRRLIRRISNKDKVVFKLSYLHGKWKIIDPPVLRISKTAMIARYEESILEYRKIINKPDISAAQKKAYQKEVETLEFLVSL